MDARHPPPPPRPWSRAPAVAAAARLGTAVLLPYCCLLSGASASDGGNSTRGGNEAEREMGETSDFKYNMTLTLSITIPAAFVIGLAWCYCMSAMCRIRDSQGSKVKGRLHLPPQTTHYSPGSYAGSDPESPPESTTAGSPPDSPVLGISPQMQRSPSGLGSPEGSRPPSPTPSIGSQRPSTSSGIGS